jgi:hypothetical protein
MPHATKLYEAIQSHIITYVSDSGYPSLTEAHAFQGKKRKTIKLSQTKADTPRKPNHILYSNGIYFFLANVANLAFVL